MTQTPLPHDPLESVERDVASIGDVPLDEQAAIFEAMHRLVTQVLSETAVRPRQPGASAAQ